MATRTIENGEPRRTTSGEIITDRASFRAGRALSEAVRARAARKAMERYVRGDQN